jgi:hypothetical protein
MILEEEQTWTERLRKSGGSWVLILTPEIREYLGIEVKDEDEILIVLKADKGRHGRFIGFGKNKG